jgi:glyoxylase-like metal-dependent hydrolase (beta-lactamase superfamily II)
MCPRRSALVSDSPRKRARGRVFDPILLEANNPGAMTGRGNNTYLVAGADGAAVLIDAGVGDPDHLTAIELALDRHRSRLVDVLVTHGHADHASGAQALSQAHPAATFTKYPWPEEDAKFGVEWRAVADEDVVAVGNQRLVALHTPGHSPDHLAFFHEATRTAFVGDLVILGGSVMIHWSRGGDLGEYLGSLERLREMRPNRMLPAHGAPIEDPIVALTAYIDHRLMREQQVIAALAAGRDTVQAIAESIYDGLNPALLPAAQENVRAHLEKLKNEKRAVNDDAVWRLW